MKTKLLLFLLLAAQTPSFIFSADNKIELTIEQKKTIENYLKAMNYRDGYVLVITSLRLLARPVTAIDPVSKKPTATGELFFVGFRGHFDCRNQTFRSSLASL